MTFAGFIHCRPVSVVLALSPSHTASVRGVHTFALFLLSFIQYHGAAEEIDSLVLGI